MDPDIASVAALIGHSARANILLALMGGVALPAGELANAANVTPQTASSHLSKLLAARLLELEVEGRRRFYRLRGPEVAALIESLGSLARPYSFPASHGSDRSNALQFARTCYNHLAGTIAVDIAEALQARGYLTAEPNRQYHITDTGRAWFRNLQINFSDLKFRSSGIAIQCLDWTERRPHLAGPVGVMFLGRLFDLKWLARGERPRAVRITSTGREKLREILGIKIVR